MKIKIKIIIPIAVVVIVITAIGVGAQPDSYNRQDLEALSTESQERSASWTEELERVLFESEEKDPRAHNLENLTEAASKELFAFFIQNQEYGIEPDQDAYLDLIEKLIDEIDIPEILFNKSDIKTTTAVDQESLRKYAQEMGRVITENSPQSEHEMDIYLEAMDKNNRIRLADLNIIIKGYNKIISEALDVSVPESALEIHLEVLNSMKRTQHNISDLTYSFIDPLRGLYGIRNYFAGADKMYKAFINVAEYFDEQGISFERGEHGWHFTYMQDLEI